MIIAAAGALALAGTARAEGVATRAGTARGEAAAPGARTTDLRQSLQELHAANRAAMQLAQVGLEKSTSQQVKDLARKMYEEHRQLDFQLTETAQQLGITFAERSDGSMMVEGELAQKSGAAFDTAFFSKVQENHRAALRAAQAAERMADRRDHPKLAEYLEGAKRDISAHLDHVRSLSATAAHGQGGGGSASAAGAGAHAADEVLTGIVASVAPDEQRLTVAPDVGRSAELRVTPQTQVIVDGRQATLADLEPGAEVRVSYQLMAEDPVAVTIETGKNVSKAEIDIEGSDPGAGGEGTKPNP